MEFFVPVPPEAASSLAMALIVSSQAPIVLLDSEFRVIVASDSFCRAFAVRRPGLAGARILDLGEGEWNVPQLRSLLRATLSGIAPVDADEMDLVRPGEEPRHLVVGVQKLDYFDGDNVRLVLAVTDVTEARLAEKLKDDLLREKQILLQELQHRVANSLQIIASVLMQSARAVQSEESRAHLHDAHHRVMSIATMQKQLAASRLGEVELRTYFSDLCDSIAASMIGRPDRLRLSSTADDSQVAADVSVSLGLIVTELVINALKHAFPGHDARGTIEVEYRASDTGWTLSVADDGVGMPGDGSGAKPGLGTGIVQALARQLGATVSVTARNPGTMVSVVHS